MLHKRLAVKIAITAKIIEAPAFDRVPLPEKAVTELNMLCTKMMIISLMLRSQNRFMRKLFAPALAKAFESASETSGRRIRNMATMMMKFL